MFPPPSSAVVPLRAARDDARRAAERGAVSAELIGVVVLVAAVIAAIWSIGIAPRIGGAGEVAVGCLFDGQDCELPTDGEPAPSTTRPDVADVAGVSSQPPIYHDRTPAGSGSSAGEGPPRSSDPRPQGEVDREAVADARHAIDHAAHPSRFRPWWMREGDSRSVAGHLEGLDGPSLDALIAGMNDAELRELFSTLGRLSSSRRAEVLAHIGSTADRDTWRRLGGFTESIDPNPTTALVDSARDEAEQDTQDWYDELGYADFDGELTALGEDDDHPISDTDFAQGSIGDCYLIAAMLALLYEDPDLLGAMLSENDNGTYTVTLAGGIDIVVSPDLPVHPDAPDQPVFARDVGGDVPGGTELYALLIEKAYAQHHGGWGAIVRGWPSEAIVDLVGGSYETIDHGRVTLADIDGWVAAGQPVTIATVPDPRPEGETEYDDGYPAAYVDGRLVHRHAYVVRGTDPDTGEVLLTNPWHPSRDPVRLTLEEFREAMGRVDVNDLDG